MSYAQANPVCEVSQYFPAIGKMAQFRHSPTHLESNERYANAVQIHHILGANSGRSNVLSNIIRVTLWAHDWVEEFTYPGMVVCLYAKRKKGECDWGELNALTAKVYPSCLDTDYVREKCLEYPWTEWTEELRQELVR